MCCHLIVPQQPSDDLKEKQGDDNKGFTQISLFRLISSEYIFLNPVFFSFMIYHRCVTRVTRLVAHVEQELLTVPEYIEVIHV
jgi:hypothetical protein